jgi:hypothetical protein
MSHDQTNDHRETMREILSYAAGGLVAMGIYLGYWWWLKIRAAFQIC